VSLSFLPVHGTREYVHSCTCVLYVLNRCLISIWKSVGRYTFACNSKSGASRLMCAGVGVGRDALGGFRLRVGCRLCPKWRRLTCSKSGRKAGNCASIRACEWTARKVMHTHTASDLAAQALLAHLLDCTPICTHTPHHTTPNRQNVIFVFSRFVVFGGPQRPQRVGRARAVPASGL
jgi:hypothetical protein